MTKEQLTERISELYENKWSAYFINGMLELVNNPEIDNNLISIISKDVLYDKQKKWIIQN